jgi:hypothetical protein
MIASSNVPISDKEGHQSSRRRGNNGANRRRRQNDKKEEPKVSEKTEEEKATTRPPSVPVSKNLVGKMSSGIISDVINRGRGKFGFIYVDPDESKSRNEWPKIYFNFKEFENKDIYPRRGYPVEFLCSTDEEGRVCATKVKLTAEGEVMAKDKAEKIAAERATASVAKETEEKNGQTEAKKNFNKRIRNRRVVSDRVIPLRVTCDGKEGEKIINAKLSQSIGKLKHTATVEFDAPTSYNVYSINDETPDGVLLSKALLRKLEDNDRIHLKPGPELAKEA